jgi:branched-chain amino acid transport system ATP-binding protein
MNRKNNLLELENIDLFHGELKALENVSLFVKPGQIVTLLGANGAGKTSLLLALSGMIKLAGGKIFFDGERIDSARPSDIVELGIVHVPEGRRLFAEMSVEENLITGSLSRRARPYRKKNMEKVYRMFPKLAERKEQRADTLSGGEQQMCAIGRGIMGVPKLILLDEPSLGLSPVMVQELFNTIAIINDEGVSVLLVEQNVYRSLKIADYGYLLTDGSIYLQGSGADLLEDSHVKTAYLG